MKPLRNIIVIILLATLLSSFACSTMESPTSPQVDLYPDTIITYGDPTPVEDIWGETLNQEDTEYQYLNGYDVYKGLPPG